MEIYDLETGERLGGGSAPHPSVFPPTSEQNPNDWWDAFVIAFRYAMRDAKTSPEDIVGISVAAQCHGLVVLDANDDVIRPAKLWNDTTSAPDLANLRDQIGNARLVDRIGTLPTAAFTIGKLAWLARVEPQNFERIAHVLLPHDYLTFRLTGRRVTDRSEASGTGYFDAATNEYLPEFLAKIDPERDWIPLLPAVLGPGIPAGEVTMDAQEALGVSAGVTVGAGGGDQHAAALGLGIVPGDVVYSFGTSGVVSALSATPIRDHQGFVDGVADMTDGFMPLVSTLNAAKTTDTFARILGLTHAELSALALRADPTDAPSLAPYLDGERTPDLPDAVGILSCLTTATTREQVAYAAYEGVILGLVSGQRHLERMGVPTNGTILAVGGGAKSAAYVQLLADATGRPVAVADVNEATARGAAVQAAAVASGRPVAEVRRQWKPTRRIVAEPRAFSNDRWEAFRAVTSIRSLDRS
ncbi:xylulokinase [Leifsonia sp. LS-T14]|uniref:xylulokinase n=1 Tax=Leifsonia sp. LS-T14 TaxID=3243763 RepID=UPI0035A7243E